MKYGIFERIGSTTNAKGYLVDDIGERMFPFVTFHSIAGGYAFWYDADMGNSNKITVQPLQ